MSQKIMYDCPFCDVKHEIYIKVDYQKALIKGTEVEFEAVEYFCPIEEEYFTPAKLMDTNLLKARDVYRKQLGLLTSEEIKNIRGFYGLTQKEYSNLLGFGDVTVQRYEKKAIQDSNYDNIMRLTFDDPSYCLKLLEQNKAQFPEARYKEIRSTIKEAIKAKANVYLINQQIYNCYIEFDELNEINGYKTLDLEKVKSIISYFTNYMVPMYKVKLMKLLWYADFLYYKYHDTSMTGLVYQHLPLGAVPVAYNQILALPEIDVAEEMNGDYVGYRITCNKNVNLTDFTLEELRVLEEVASFFKDFKSKGIVDYMHKELAYKNTSFNEIIFYSWAKQLKDLKR